MTLTWDKATRNRIANAALHPGKDTVITGAHPAAGW